MPRWRSQAAGGIAIRGCPLPAGHGWAITSSVVARASTQRKARCRVAGSRATKLSSRTTTSAPCSKTRAMTRSGRTTSVLVACVALLDENLPMQILHYLTAEGRDLFQDWLDRLHDMRARVAIQRRIDRLVLGNFGDHRFRSDGVGDVRSND